MEQDHRCTRLEVTPGATFVGIRSLKIALVAAEIAPFAKTGGLADVVASLGRALHRQGHEVRLFLPLYGTVEAAGFEVTPTSGSRDIQLDYPGRSVTVGVSTVPLPNSMGDDGSTLDVELLDCPELYHRDGYYTSDPDEPLRWATLCRGVLEVLAQSAWAPDVIHCNDWHTGLLPLYLGTSYRSVPSLAATATLLSIHNLSFSGIFAADAVDQLGLSAQRHLFHQERLQAGLVSFLETGILYATWLSTVSETYAREIQDPEHGMGLDELLRTRADHLVGIVNGIDPTEWSPDQDLLIPHRFTAGDLLGKDRCREALLDRFNIAGESSGPSRPGWRREPVMAIVSRLTEQKGFELLTDILPTHLQHGHLRLVVLGSGEERYERYFQRLRDAFPDRVGVYFGFDEELAHWIEAGADVFLMPSRYEPCGLNQLFSMSYGTIPLVRRTGGLADTVQQWDPATGTGTGFVFDEFRSQALSDTFDQVLATWADPYEWAVLMGNGMAQDFSWDRQSAHYVELYERILE